MTPYNQGRSRCTHRQQSQKIKMHWRCDLPANLKRKSAKEWFPYVSKSQEDDNWEQGAFMANPHIKAPVTDARWRTVEILMLALADRDKAICSAMGCGGSVHGLRIQEAKTAIELLLQDREGYARTYHVPYSSYAKLDWKNMSWCVSGIPFVCCTWCAYDCDCRILPWHLHESGFKSKTSSTILFIPTRAGFILFTFRPRSHMTNLPVALAMQVLTMLLMRSKPPL